MSFFVIGVVGLQGSGKTEVARAAAELGIPCVRMGDVVWAEVKRRGLELNDANVAAVANELREREGLGAVARRCVPLIERAGEEKRAVIVDGIRGIAEVEEFRRAFGGRFHLLAVKANERLRYSRVMGRGREDDVEGLEAFRERDSRELGWGLGEALEAAELTLTNEGTLAEFHGKVTRAITGILEGKSETASRG